MAVAYVRQIAIAGGAAAPATTAIVLTNTGAIIPVGSLIIVRIGSRGAVVTFGVTDSAGNSWIGVGGDVNQSNVFINMVYAFTTVAIPVNGTITITRSASVSMVASAELISGANGQTSGLANAGGTGAATVTTANAMPAGGYFVVGHAAISGAVAPTQSNNFINFGSSVATLGGSASTSNFEFVGGYFIPAAGNNHTYAPAGTTSAFSDKIVGFAPAGGIVAPLRRVGKFTY